MRGGCAAASKGRIPPRSPFRVPASGHKPVTCGSRWGSPPAEFCLWPALPAGGCADIRVGVSASESERRPAGRCGCGSWRRWRSGTRWRSRRTGPCGSCWPWGGRCGPRPATAWRCGDGRGPDMTATLRLTQGQCCRAEARMRKIGPGNQISESLGAPSLKIQCPGQIHLSLESPSESGRGQLEWRKH